MAYKEVEVLASAARTATGEGSLVDTASGATFFAGPASGDPARFYLDVSAASGTMPTLDVTLIATMNSVDYTVGTFAQKTAAGKETITVSGCPHNIKAKYTIGGAIPSFTFQVWCSR